MKIQGLVIALVATVLLAPRPALSAGPIVVNGAGEPLVWTAAPVIYNPDRGKLGDLSNAVALSHLATGAAVWTDVATAGVTLAAGVQLPVDVVASNAVAYLSNCGDGLSPIVFDEDGSITDNLYGVGANNHIIGFAAPACGTYVPAVVTEGFSVLNGRFLDGVDTASNPELTADEFDAVLTHELGHYLGLDHSQVGLAEARDGLPANDDAIATMYPILAAPTEQRALNRDDVTSISTLYPTTTFLTDFGIISGSITMPNGDPFQGVHVVARAVADPRITAVGNVSGARFFPNTFGGPPDPALRSLYELRGLPPGDYTVEIERVDPAFTGGSSVGPLETPIGMPGPPEYWNGANEAAAEPPDDPTDLETVSVAAGATIGAIDVVINQYPPPANDECSNATVIAATPFADTVEASTATLGAFDPVQSCTEFPSQSGSSVWYRFTAPADGVLHVDTTGSGYDTVVAVLTGACGSLSEESCDDNDGPGLLSALDTLVTAGTSYAIEAASVQYGASTLQLAVDFTPAATCAPAPASGCHAPTVTGKSSIKWTAGTKPQVAWKWLPGTTALAELGTPLAATGTTYAFCAYDASAQLIASAQAPAGTGCGSGLRECWRQGSSGFTYKDRELLPDGLQLIQMKAGDAGRARVSLKGKGATLAVPTLPAAFPLTVQLVNSAGQCWQSTYPASGIQKNDPLQLKAKGG